MEARYIFILVRKWFWLIILACLLSGAAGLAVSLVQPKMYESQTTLYLTSPNRGDYNAVLGAQQAAKSFAFIPNSGPVLGATLQAVSDRSLSLSQLSSMITVQNDINSQFVVIQVRDSNPIRAARLASEIAKQSVARYEEVTTDGNQAKQFVKQEMDRIEIRILDLENQLLNIRAQAGGSLSPSQTASIQSINTMLLSMRTVYNQLLTSYVNMGGFQVVILQDAQVPMGPVGSGRMEAIAIGMLAGLIIIVAVILFIEQRNGILQPSTKVSPVVMDLSTDITINGFLGRPKPPPGAVANPNVLRPKNQASDEFQKHVS